jgi:hypothetical protein
VNQADRVHLLDELYELLEVAATEAGGPRPLGAATGRDGWPTHGVYFLFEPGEVRADGHQPRIVRVGTHGLTATSKSNLWTRLRTHRGGVGGRNPGGGNHRGSVFRFHVGTALIARDGHPTAAASWGLGPSAPREVRDQEVALERAVSRHIAQMQVVCLAVPDRQMRATIERGCIALLSNHDRGPVDPPSSQWLGRYADREAVRRSGLWNVDHVTSAPDPGTLPLIRSVMSR